MAEPFLSEIRMMSFVYAPKGWALCNGQLLPINQNQALFSLLGTTYGGDGRVNFALPDLRGGVPIHVGSGHILGERVCPASVGRAMNRSSPTCRTVTRRSLPMIGVLDTYFPSVERNHSNKVHFMLHRARVAGGLPDPLAAGGTGRCLRARGGLAARALRGTGGRDQDRGARPLLAAPRGVCRCAGGFGRLSLGGTRP